MKSLPVRLHSIDVFRAVTMFLMIFVNDVGAVTNIPEWIKHAAAQTRYDHPINPSIPHQ